MASTTASTYNWTKRITSTMEKFIPKLTDNITQRIAFKAALKDKGAIVMREGGEKHGTSELVLPLMTGLNTNFKWLANDFDTFSAEVIDGETVCGYNYASCVCPIVLSESQIERNQSDAGALNLIQDTMDQTKNTMAEMEEKTLCSYSTAAASANTRATAQPAGIVQTVWPYDADGTATIDGVSNANRTWNTFGLINRSTASNAFWRNQSVDANDHMSSTDDIENALNGGDYEVQKYGGRISLWLMDLIAYKKLQQREFSKRTYQVTGSIKKTSLVDLGVPHQIFNDATVVWSHYIVNPNTTSHGVAYGIDTDYTKLYINPKRNMQLVGWEKVRGDSTQLVWKAFIKHAMTMATTNSRNNVVVYDIGKSS